MHMSVCLTVFVYVCLSASPGTAVQSSRNFVHVTYGRGSVLSGGFRQFDQFGQIRFCFFPCLSLSRGRQNLAVIASANFHVGSIT